MLFMGWPDNILFFYTFRRDGFLYKIDRVLKWIHIFLVYKVSDLSCCYTDTTWHKLRSTDLSLNISPTSDEKPVRPPLYEYLHIHKLYVTRHYNGASMERLSTEVIVAITGTSGKLSAFIPLLFQRGRRTLIIQVQDACMLLD